MSIDFSEIDQQLFDMYSKGHIVKEVMKTLQPENQAGILDLFSSLYRGRKNEMIDMACKASVHFIDHTRMAMGDPVHSVYMSYMMDKYLRGTEEEVKKTNPEATREEIIAAMAGKIEGDDGMIGKLTEMMDGFKALAQTMMEGGDMAGTQDGQLLPADVEKINQILSAAADSNMSKILSVMGAMLAAYKKQFRQSVTSSPIVPVDVEFGDNLKNLVGSEYNNLVHPQLKKLFALRVAQKRLLTYKRQHHEDTSRGALAICLDISGSMQSWCMNHNGRDYDRSCVGAGLALAMISICRKENRDYKMYLFGNNTTFLLSKEKEKSFIDTIHKVVKAAQGNGGTNIMQLLASMKSMIASEERAEAKRPDIVIISDMEDRCSPDVAEEIKRSIRPSHVHALVIGPNMDSEWNAVLTTATATTNLNNMAQFAVDSTRKRKSL